MLAEDVLLVARSVADCGDTVIAKIGIKKEKATMWRQNVVPCCAFFGCSGWVLAVKRLFILPQFRSINSCENSKCLRNKVLKTLGYVRNFTYLGAAKLTSKQNI
ncbi:MAG: hypothetical protein ACFNVK_04965 [Prevotella sp.]